MNTSSSSILLSHRQPVILSDHQLLEMAVQLLQGGILRMNGTKKKSEVVKEEHWGVSLRTLLSLPCFSHSKDSIKVSTMRVWSSLLAQKKDRRKRLCCHLIDGPPPLSLPLSLFSIISEIISFRYRDTLPQLLKKQHGITSEQLAKVTGLHSLIPLLRLFTVLSSFLFLFLFPSLSYLCFRTSPPHLLLLTLTQNGR